jgi:hypothetical protein
MCDQIYKNIQVIDSQKNNNLTINSKSILVINSFNLNIELTLDSNNFIIIHSCKNIIINGKKIIGGCEVHKSNNIVLNFNEIPYNLETSFSSNIKMNSLLINNQLLYNIINCLDIKINDYKIICNPFIQLKSFFPNM